VATIALAATLRVEALIVISIAIIFGLIYSLPILPGKWSKIFHLHRFSDIPGSKDMLVAGAWAATTVLIHPLSLQGLRIFDPSALIVFLWVFGLVFNQMIVAEMRYLQGDAILGQTTLPVLLGKKQINRLLSIIDLFLIIILLLGGILGICTELAYFMLIPLAYSIGLQRFHRKIRIKNSLTFEAALLMEFFFFGLVALVWKLL
jgi:4-hydroxybenzoate polyprenyltransferase